MSIKKWPTNERPREKLLEQGAAMLSDAELLAILLRTGTRNQSAVMLARDLLSEFKSLGALLTAEPDELTKHKGIGPASYTQFAVVLEIGRRVLKEELEQRESFSDPDKVADYLRMHLGMERVEVMIALLLNRQNELLRSVELARGTISENTVYMREVVRLTIQYDAAAIIVAHNHPGGGEMPSSADIAFTRNLKEAMRLIDVDLLDHFIVTKSKITSFRQQGLLGQ